MIRYVIVSLCIGLLFGILDGLINGNPIAIKRYEVFKPISRNRINIPVGIISDIVYGFIINGLFIVLYNSIPGDIALIKGVVFTGIIWIFRVLMNSVSQWMMFNIPIKTILYSLISGLLEMTIIGIIVGIFSKR